MLPVGERRIIDACTYAMGNYIGYFTSLCWIPSRAIMSLAASVIPAAKKSWTSHLLILAENSHGTYESADYRCCAGNVEVVRIHQLGSNPMVSGQRAVPGLFSSDRAVDCIESHLQTCIAQTAETAVEYPWQRCSRQTKNDHVEAIPELQRAQASAHVKRCRYRTTNTMWTSTAAFSPYPVYGWASILKTVWW